MAMDDDSSATHHMSPQKSDFVNYTPCPGTVHRGDKSTVDQVGVGSVVLKTSEGTQLTLTNVLHIPNIMTRFLSNNTAFYASLVSVVCQFARLSAPIS